MGIFGLFAGLLILLGTSVASLIVGMNASANDSMIAIPIITGAGFLISGLVMLTPAIGVLAGIGMYKYASWGRVLGVIVSVLYIPFHFPFGTLLGIYTLWVLLSSETSFLFDRPNPAPFQS